MTLTKNTRMVHILNHRIKVVVKDGRWFIGQMIAFDRHMNLVLADCEEFRRVKSAKKKLQQKKNSPGATQEEEKRMLGLLILRGENVVSLASIAPPSSASTMLGPKRQSVAASMSKTAIPNLPGSVRPMPGRGGMPIMGAPVSSSSLATAPMIPGVPPMPPPGVMPPHLMMMRPPHMMPPVPPNMMMRPPHLHPSAGPGAIPYPLPPHMGMPPGMPMRPAGAGMPPGMMMRPPPPGPPQRPPRQ